MKKRIGLSLLSLLVCIWAMASDTSVKNDAGVEIWYDFDSSAKTASVTYKGSDSWSEGYYTGEVVIPSKVTYEGVEYSVTSIGENAFFFCDGLTDVTIPNSVTSIEWQAFSHCDGLTNVTIPNRVTSIGDGAFYGCSGLTSITIPNRVTSIGDGAFSDCSGLTSITIPNSVTSIGESAFEDCDGLTSITIPNSVTSIGERAFKDCDGLTSITIPNSVTTIGGYAFYYCSGLTNVTIPNSVTTIGYHAFSYCSGLTNVTIPNSVTSIGDWAFQHCSGLTSITCKNTTPPVVGIRTFSGVDKSIPLYVPAESVEAYKSEAYWNEFTNILPISADDSPISDVKRDNITVRPIGNNIVVTGADDYVVYTISGQCLGKASSVERGLYIVVVQGKSYKVIVK